MSKLEPCPECCTARAEGRFEDVADCHGCRGKGFRRGPTSYVCNKCGGSMCPNPKSMNAEIPHGLVDAEVVGGYDSPHLTDTTGYKFSLCEGCLRELFTSCKVPPEVRHYSLGVIGDKGAEQGYAEDLDWYNFTRWRDAGGPAKKFPTGLCNYREWCQEPGEWRHFVSGHMTEEAWCSEHKKLCYGNSLFVPTKEVADVPLNKDERTQEHHIQIANAFLKASVRDWNQVTWFRYLGECLREATGTDVDESGGLFVPPSIRNKGMPDLGLDWEELEKLYLPIGVLLYGRHDRVYRFGSRGFNRGVVPAKVLPGLPDDDEEENAA